MGIGASFSSSLFILPIIFIFTLNLQLTSTLTEGSSEIAIINVQPIPIFEWPLISDNPVPMTRGGRGHKKKKKKKKFKFSPGWQRCSNYGERCILDEDCCHGECNYLGWGHAIRRLCLNVPFPKLIYGIHYEKKQYKNQDKKIKKNTKKWIKQRDKYIKQKIKQIPIKIPKGYGYGWDDWK